MRKYFWALRRYLTLYKALCSCFFQYFIELLIKRIWKKRSYDQRQKRFWNLFPCRMTLVTHPIFLIDGKIFRLSWPIFFSINSYELCGDNAIFTHLSWSLYMNFFFIIACALLSLVGRVTALFSTDQLIISMKPFKLINTIVATNTSLRIGVWFHAESFPCWSAYRSQVTFHLNESNETERVYNKQFLWLHKLYF